jgi:hypothetical protein
MRKICIILALFPFISWSQVGVGTSAPASSSVLDVTSTSKGFLPPRMSAAQRTGITSPATGLIVYQTDGVIGLYAYNGTSWIPQVDWYTTTGSPASSFALVQPAGVTSAANANYGIGSNALVALTSGDQNTALGYEAIKSVTNASNNSAIGYAALSATTGAGNTAIGHSAGLTNTSGSNNTYIGTSADASAASLSNATALGYQASVSSSNTIQLGNTSVTSVNTSGAISTSSNITASGSVGIGTSSPVNSAALEITSTNKGVLLPRLTTSQRATISLPDPGLLIYNTTTGKAQVYTGTPILSINTNPNNTSSMGASYTGPGNFDAQTITALSNEKISSIQVSLMNSVNTATQLSALIYAGVYNQNASPSQTPLGTSATITTSASGGWHTLTFNTPVSITLNSVYTIVFRNTGSGDLFIDNSSTTGYSGGTQFGDPGNPDDLFLKVFVSGSWVDLN